MTFEHRKLELTETKNFLWSTAGSTSTSTEIRPIEGQRGVSVVFPAFGETSPEILGEGRKAGENQRHSLSAKLRQLDGVPRL